MTAPRDLTEALERLDKVKELHPDCNDRCGICHICHQVYPCRTIRILEGKS